MRPIVTLTTDFGSQDPYVGIMKGVILSICPEAQIVDLSHEIAPQQIIQAALVIESAFRFFPARTVHVVVVDPGVGTGRKAIALQTPQGVFLAPDNGVLDLIAIELKKQPSASGLKAVELTDQKFFLSPISATFHGRDVFAPVAAHLAQGTRLEELGPAAEPLISLHIPQPRHECPGRLTGEVIYIDRFGNCVTNILRADLQRLGASKMFEVVVGGETIGPLRRTYGDVESNQLVALIGSGGRLEISLRNGNCSRFKGWSLGTTVETVLTE